MIKILLPILLFAVITVGLTGFATSSNAQTVSSSNNPHIDAKTVYEQKSAVLGNDIRHFVVLIPNEAHESLNQPKNQYPLADQAYIPQDITVNRGTSVTWLSGDVDHVHTIKFQAPNPENLAATEKFQAPAPTASASGSEGDEKSPSTLPGFVSVTFNQLGKYSYYEDNVNDQDTAFVMRGTVNVVDSNQKTPISNSSLTQPIKTAGVLMVPSKDLQTISSTLKNNGITVLSDYTFADLRGGQKGTGKTQAIIVWGSDKDNVDQALLPIIDVAKGLPYS
jgi:plastocyanin